MTEHKIAPMIQPAAMTRQVAAAFCGCSLTKFDELVAHGILPAPRQIGSLKRYARTDLETAILTAPTAAESPSHGLQNGDDM